MKVSEANAEYYAMSAKASDVCRQLSLAGIAVVWLFKVDRPAGAVALSLALLLALGAFAVALAMDLTQYAVGSAVWQHLARTQYVKHGADGEVDAGPSWNWPTSVLFWGKLGVALAGMGLVVAHIVSRLA